MLFVNYEAKTFYKQTYISKVTIHFPLIPLNCKSLYFRAENDHVIFKSCHKASYYWEAALYYVYNLVTTIDLCWGKVTTDCSVGGVSIKFVALTLLLP